jgi:hypothetical protein
MKSKRPLLVYLTPSVLLALHQVLQAFQLSSPFCRSYLDDFLVIPTVLGIWLCVARLFNHTIHTIDLYLAGFMGVAFFSILFEHILPKQLASTTKDYWDILAYSIGALSYLFVLELTPKPKSA